MPFRKSDLVESLETCLEERENLLNELQMWTEALEDLSELEDAFEIGYESKLHEKTILDIGTDCIKPLYIVLKFEPKKIIGIDENLSYSFASALEQKSRLLTKTRIGLYNCSLFDKENLRKILAKEKQASFDFVLLSKTLHHLRKGKCMAKENDQKHRCQPDEEDCIYRFEEKEIFNDLLQLGRRVIVYEYFYPKDKDEDKIRGRGGYFMRKEWRRIFNYLYERHRVRFIRPQQFHLNKETICKVDSILGQVDYLCFYVEG